MSKPHYRTIFMSDVHLGTPDAKAAEAIWFLKHTTCDQLILNGDIIDGWHLKRGGNWQDDHTKFVRTVLRKMEKEDVEVIYLRGNHDDILERFLPIEVDKLSIVQEHIHKTPQGDYLVVHGDGFDAVTTNLKVVAILGSVGYYLLLRVNRIYNKWRAWRGKEYFSLSKNIKGRVKSAVNFLGRYEEQLQAFARTRDCVGIICGHVHTADDKMIDGVHYLNSGDWVESLTAIVEKEPGDFELIGYEAFRAGMESSKKKKTLQPEEMQEIAEAPRPSLVGASESS